MGAMRKRGGCEPAVEDEQRRKRRREEPVQDAPAEPGATAPGQRSEPAAEPETAPPTAAAGEVHQRAVKGGHADGMRVGDGGTPPPPDNHHLPRGLRWDEFQQHFKSYPPAFTQERWDLYLGKSERVAIRGVPQPPGATGMAWAGRRVLIEEIGERGTITSASHGFFIVHVDSRNNEKTKQTIRKRGFELLIADDEDRIRLGKVSGDVEEPRCAAPRPQPRKPTGVDIADRLWAQKEGGVEWVRRRRARWRNTEAENGAETLASKIVIDSWGAQWNSETGMPHTASLRESAPAKPRREKPAHVTHLSRLSVHPAAKDLADGTVPPIAPGAAYKCEKGKLYLVNGQKRISDGKSWRCEHYRQPSQCQMCGGAGVCEHGRRRSACLECNKSNPHSHLWRSDKRNKR